MSIDIQNIRNNYQAVCKKIQADQVDRRLVSLVESSRVYAEKQVAKMVSNQQYEYYQEASTYIAKYQQLTRLFNQRAKARLNSREFKTKVNQVIGVSFGIQNENTNSKFISPQRVALNKFFGQKNSQFRSPTNNASSILQTPLTPSKSFKKRRNEGNGGVQIQELIYQNNKLKEQLRDRQSNMQRGSEYSHLYQKNRESIKSLQEYNSQLIRDNFKLKSQKSGTVKTSQNNEEDDFLYSPYNFFTRKNNIHEINVRNMYSEGYEQSQADDFQDNEVVSPQQHIIQKRVGYQYDTYSEQDYKRQKGNVNYSVFDATKSYYSDQGELDSFNNSKRFQNNKILIKSKMAFFKEKGILYRNGQLQIGFKRSYPQNTNKVRVILFFNNKSPDYKTIRIDYEYQQDYYQVIVSEKIREIQGLKQGRQVVEVTLRGNRPDFNSLIDAIITIGTKQYRFILPAMFFTITKSPSQISNQQQGSKSIFPIKSFNSPAQAKKTILQLQNLNANQAQFFCESIKGNGVVKIFWKQDKGKLQIRSSRRWLQFWSFLFLDSA